MICRQSPRWRLALQALKAWLPPKAPSRVVAYNGAISACEKEGLNRADMCQHRGTSKMGRCSYVWCPFKPAEMVPSVAVVMVTADVVAGKPRAALGPDKQGPHPFQNQHRTWVLARIHGPKRVLHCTYGGGGLVCIWQYCLLGGSRLEWSWF